MEITSKKKSDQKLDKSLNFVETISLAASDISPTSGVFLNIPVVLAMAGTGSFIVALLAGVVALCVALTMAEVGSAFPQSGGIYSVIHKILGYRIGFIALIAYLVEGIFIPAVTSMGAATYLVSVFPQLSVHWVAPIIMIVATIISIMNISSTGKFTSFLLVLELLVVITITVGCLFNIHQPVSALFSNNVLVHGKLSSVSISTIFAAIAVMLFSFNGFDSALNFSEELKGGAKSVGRSVLSAAGIGIVAQLIPLAFIILAAPSLPLFLKSSNPVLYVANKSLGSTIHTILSLGIALAMFACTISVLLQFSRVLYTSGRDNMWSHGLNKFFQSIHPKFKTPWKATIFLGLVDVILNFVSNLSDLISFTSVLVVLLYALIGICDLITRHRKIVFPYRNPLGSIPAILTIIAAVYAISQQGSKNLIISAIILIISAIYVSFQKNRSKADLNL